MNRSLWMLALVSAMALGASATAQPETSAPSSRLIEKPDWARKPTGQDVERFYPSEARKRNVSGSAVISCTVTAEGLLTGCQVIEESPQGLGFGEAALKMSPIFKMRGMSKDGQPVAGGTVRIPFQLRVF